MEWYWQGKLQYWDKSLSKCHYVHHKSRVNWPGVEPGPFAVRGIISKRTQASPITKTDLFLLSEIFVAYRANNTQEVHCVCVCVCRVLSVCWCALCTRSYCCAGKEHYTRGCIELQVRLQQAEQLALVSVILRPARSNPNMETSCPLSLRSWFFSFSGDRCSNWATTTSFRIHFIHSFIHLLTRPFEATVYGLSCWHSR